MSDFHAMKVYAEGLEVQLAAKDAELLALRSAHWELKDAIASYLADVEIGGFGRPSSDRLRAALAASAPSPLQEQALCGRDAPDVHGISQTKCGDLVRYHRHDTFCAHCGRRYSAAPSPQDPTDQ